MIESSDSPQIAAIVLSLCLSLVAIFFAKRAGLFKLPPIYQSSWPRFSQVLGAFLVYLIISFILVPIVYIAIALYRGETLQQLEQASFVKNWLQWGALVVLLGALIVYLFWIPSVASRTILWGPKKPSWTIFLKDTRMGVLAWAISYPIVILTSLLTGMLSQWFWGKSGVEQLAVKQLLDTRDNLSLYVAMAIAVIFIVPFIEELLFRGFLQSWLRRKLGRWAAIFLTAFIFACVHFAASQGIGNFELIGSLFVLSCFLGYIYERQQTLWASIGLHFSFNAFSVLVLSFSK